MSASYNNLVILNNLSVSGFVSLSEVLTSTSSCTFPTVNTGFIYMSGDLLQTGASVITSGSAGIISNGITRLMGDVVVLGGVTFSSTVFINNSLYPLQSYATNANIISCGNKSIITKGYSDSYYAQLTTDNVFSANNSFTSGNAILSSSTNINILSNTKSLITKAYSDSYYAQLSIDNVFLGINSFVSTSPILCFASNANILANTKSLITKAYADVYYLSNQSSIIGCWVYTNTSVFPIYASTDDYGLYISKKDVEYLLLPSYKLVVYSGLNATLTSCILDNTNSFIAKRFTAVLLNTGASQGMSCKLYYKNTLIVALSAPTTVLYV